MKNLSLQPNSFVLIASILILTAMGTQTMNYHPIRPYQPEPAVTVEMTNTLKFTPDTVHIEKGQTVKWVNSSLLVHSVTADPAKETIEGSVHLPENAKPFDSGMMDPKETFSHTFQTAGSYTYFCIPHEAAKMRGVVVVR